jgi:hypothetical protein
MVTALLGAGALASAACSGAGGEETEPDKAEFCDRLTAAAGLTLAFDQLDLAALRVLVPDLESAVPVAPPEIQGAAGDVAGYARAVLDRWEAADPLDAEAAADAFRDLDSRRAEVEAAGVELEEYARAECDLDLRNPPTSSTTVPPATTADTTATTESADSTTAPPTTAAVVGTTTVWTPAPTASIPPDATTVPNGGVPTTSPPSG